MSVLITVFSVQSMTLRSYALVLERTSGLSHRFKPRAALSGPVATEHDHLPAAIECILCFVCMLPSASGCMRRALKQVVDAYQVRSVPLKVLPLLLCC